MARSAKGIDTKTLSEARKLLAAQDTPVVKRYAAVLGLATRSKGALRAVAQLAEQEDSGFGAWLVDQVGEADATPRALVRRALGREQGARERLNPIHRDEGFSCEHCDSDVLPAGGTPRNHCPFCLWSKHVDRVPGDRAESCGGLMKPLPWQREGGRITFRHRCSDCGFERAARFRDDGCVQADSMAALLAIAKDSEDPAGDQRA